MALPVTSVSFSLISRVPVATKTIFITLLLSAPVFLFVVLFSRFGKHRKDERPGEKMDRKGSSKWRPEETQVSEEETMRMRMEQER